ncbi:MAG TPA: ABC transporter permease [Lacunisphaera sp.]|nr:ABC transporter permease [Lacunisphaera sp.]
MKFAFRSLLKSPGYTIVALITLALGIGVNTSMFSVVDTLLFRSAPYPHAEQLVMLHGAKRGDTQRFFSAQEIAEIEPAATGFSSLLTLGHAMYSMVDGDRPAERIHGVVLSRGMGDVFGIPPLLGRAFAPEEFLPGKNQVVLLNESYWLARFGGDPAVIGRTLRLDGEAVTIIGVMPLRFDYKFLWGNVALIRPLNYTSDQRAYRGYSSFQLIGRLAPGVTAADAVARLAPVAAAQEKAFPQDYPGMNYRAIPLHETTMDNVGRSISWLLLGLSGFVLLICCANLANLQLARATASAREFAIRAALGASRSRLVVQQLNECILLSLAGGALGIVVALWINSLLERSILIDGATGLHVTLDAAVLGIAVLVSLLTGVAFGVVPALFAARSDVNSTLKSQSRGSTTGRGHNVMRHGLIVAEIALALVLLGGAAIMNRGFDRLLERNPGWDTDRILTGIINLPENRFDNAKRLAFFRQLEDKLNTLPGVEKAALSNTLPLFPGFSDKPVFTDAPGANSAGSNPTASHILITPDYFATLGIPLLDGRLFPADITADGPQYILVNEALARRFWPGKNAIGQRLGVNENNTTVWREVIGVVGNTEPAASITNPATPFQVFRPLRQEPWSTVDFIVRSPQPMALLETVRRAITSIDADLAADQIGTVVQTRDRTQHNLIVVGHMLAGFAVLGLALASIGVYGVISHLVAQRSGEFGIRLALGALPRDILADVLLRGLKLCAIGLALGLAGAYGLGRFLASFMHRLAASDPLAIAGSALVLFAVTVVACWIPARRATKVDPLEALRAE